MHMFPPERSLLYVTETRHTREKKAFLLSIAIVR